MRILLAEDEKALSHVLVKIFEKNNYSVDAVYNGEDALALIQSDNIDVAVLDVMMPKMDGITVLKKARAAGIQIPILMLTAKSEIEDRVLGLDCGANDYLSKPFDSRELLARIRSITRGKKERDSKLSFGNLVLNKATFELSSEKEIVSLISKEFQLMELFMSYPNQKFSSEHLLEKIWGYNSDVEINVVWVNISYLRKKLSAIGANVQIKAYRNAGYALEVMHD